MEFGFAVQEGHENERDNEKFDTDWHVISVMHDTEKPWNLVISTGMNRVQQYNKTVDLAKYQQN